MTLTGANTYTGVSTLNAGIINLGVAENAGVSGPLGKSAAGNPNNIVLGGGTLQYTGSGSTTDRNYTFGTGNTSGGFDSEGTGPLVRRRVWVRIHLPDRRQRLLMNLTNLGDSE